MNLTLKRIISLFLSLIILSGALALPVRAEGITYDGLYGYSLLSDTQKEIYEALDLGIRRADETITFGSSNRPTKASFDDIMAAFLADNPQYFWFTGAYSYSPSSSRIASVIPEYTLSGNTVTKDDIAVANSSFTAKAKAILDEMESSCDDTDYARALWLHDKVASLVYYDFGPNHQTAYGALVDGVAVCAGYTRLYQYFLQEAGIKAFTVSGETDEGVAHAWNLMWLNGHCLYTDVTWNDQGDDIYHLYFADDIDSFSLQHIADPEYFASVLPECCGECGKQGYFDIISPENVFTASTTPKDIAPLLTNTVPDKKWEVHLYDNTGTLIDWLNSNWIEVVKAADLPGYNFGCAFTYLRIDGNEIELIFMLCNENFHASVSFLPNGGKGEMPSMQTDLFGFTLPQCTFTAPEGKFFKGWKIGGGMATPGNRITVTSDIIISAIWEDIPKEKYTVSFLGGGGNGSMPSATDLFGEYTLPECGFTAPEGYSFKCWSINGSEAMPGDSINVTGNTTVTALWKANQYTITFNTDGGSAVSPITADYGTAITAPEAPTKTGYTFKGWDKEIPATMPAENITLTALWEINQYTITFNTDGGSAVSPITADYGTAITAPEAPTKTGYTFMGWDKEIPTTIPAENITITALWKINQYTITFNTNGGSAVSPITADFGTAVTAPEAPTKTGYTFKGWDKEIPATVPAENVTITALWEINKYSVTFNANGGSGSMTADPVEHNGQLILPYCTLTSPYGKRFKCWNVNSTEKAPGDKITVTSNITVTAIWEDIPADGSVTLSGTVTSYGKENTTVTIELIKNGEVIRTVNTAGNTAAYAFNGVAEGNYILRISKKKHATAEYTVTVSGNTAANGEIMLYGDVNGDGKVNAGDATQIKRNYNNKASVFDSYDDTVIEYIKKIADVNGDGNINAGDATQIKRYYNNKASVFDRID